MQIMTQLKNSKSGHQPSADDRILILYYEDIKEVLIFVRGL